MIEQTSKTLILVFLGLAMLSAEHAEEEQDDFELTVTFKGSFDGEGKLYLDLLDAKGKRVDYRLEDVKNNVEPIVIKGISKGAYVVKCYVDLNGNGKLDKNLIGLPTEPWGVSNNPSIFLGPPSLKNMLFQINADKTIEIELR